VKSRLPKTLLFQIHNLCRYTAGDMFLMQALHGEAHPLLPSGPGLYKLAGEGLYEMLVARVTGEDGRGLSLA
jgi:hypothetical protein